ncbi:hypothetical protein Tola_1165 [Tolumonas auensis DSM 9187]|uniref:Uncharacterized protein n=1 Tax=Tolumonas auensis (strain DSM 9187 / NBRC 110442 / TA 4) TaxID=595494 RepID=C4LDJ1_TOLAT|nr:hypothetical protein [Tolumonas auensis]ACQ92787.1 hypothetical protein Tola_1165 [Tolumonas auensis DSM 9187]
MMLIIEKDSVTDIVGLKRHYSIWTDGSMVPVNLFEKVEMVMLISPNFEQLEQIKKSNMTACNVYVALTASADQLVRFNAECSGFRVMTYDVGDENNLIKAMLSVFNAKRSFGADLADIRKLFSKSSNIHYKHVSSQITAESIQNIQLAGNATSIVSTVFYDAAFSFEILENVFTWLKDRFSTVDIVASYSSDAAASLGLFLALD